jgi:hypothetical protein
MTKGESMLTTVARWAPGLLAVFLLGPLAGWMVGLLRGPDGGSDASLLVNTSPILGLLVMIGVFALAGGSALLATKLVGFRTATWAAGYTLAWAAYMATDVPNLVRTHQSGPFVRLAIEGLFCGGLALVIFVALAAVAHDRSHRFGMAATESRQWLMAQMRERSSWVGAGVALVVGGVVAHVVNIEPMKGQAIFAAVIAGLAAGAAGSWVGSFVGPTPREPMVAVGFCLLAFVGPVVGMVLHGGEAALTAANNGSMFGPSAMIGMDWAAGLFLGLPAGVALIESTVEHQAKLTA